MNEYIPYNRQLPSHEDALAQDMERLLAPRRGVTKARDDWREVFQVGRVGRIMEHVPPVVVRQKKGLP